MIHLVDLKKKFDDRYVTDGINLSIPESQITVIIGRSGEGKSVLLKQIIGLIKPTSGHIYVDGIDVAQLKGNKEQQAFFKKCGYVFQFAALLDSLTVFENVALPLLENGINSKEALETVKEKLSLVNLGPEILHKYPSQLSGGMKKRVGIARSLIHSPQILFYDEPTTGLDPINTRVVHELMYNMQRTTGVTTIVISHDIEIFKYVDNVALLHEGKIQYFGSAQTIWESDNPYVYQFIRGLSEGPMQTDNDFEEFI